MTKNMSLVFITLIALLFSQASCDETCTPGAETCELFSYRQTCWKFEIEPVPGNYSKLRCSDRTIRASDHCLAQAMFKTSPYDRNYYKVCAVCEPGYYPDKWSDYRCIPVEVDVHPSCTKVTTGDGFRPTCTSCKDGYPVDYTTKCKAASLTDNCLEGGTAVSCQRCREGYARDGSAKKCLISKWEGCLEIQKNRRYGEYCARCDGRNGYYKQQPDGGCAKF